MSEKQPPGNGPAVYNAAELCGLFRCSIPTIRKAVAEGVIPKPLRLGARTVWPKVQIDALLSGGAIQTAARVGSGEPIRTAALRVGGQG